MEITVEVHAEGQGYWSQVREFPGCFASGRTLSELHEAIGDAIGLYLWDIPATLRDADLTVGEVHVHVIPPEGMTEPAP